MNPLPNQNRLKSRFQRIAHWYSYIATVLFSTLVLLVLLNFSLATAFYLTGRHRSEFTGGTIPSYPEKAFRTVYPDFTSHERALLLRESWLRSLGYEDYVHFRERPYKGKYVNVAEAGFRLSKEQGPWPIASGNLNVFVFGGSTTFGYGLPDYQTVPSQLQEILSRHFAVEEAAAKEPATSDGPVKFQRPQRKVCVYNFGAGWYHSTQERILLERLVSDGHQPDVAIFIDGFNDLGELHDNPAYRSVFQRMFNEQADSLVSSTIARTSTGRFINGLRRRLAETPPQIEIDQGAVRLHLQRYLKKKKMTEAICQEFGITPIFVWQPVPDYKYDSRYHLFLKPIHKVQSRIYGYEQMAKYYKDGLCGTNFLWCADIQENARECLYVDCCHYTATFARTFAETVFQMALQRGLLARHGYRSEPIGSTARAAVDRSMKAPL